MAAMISHDSSAEISSLSSGGMVKGTAELAGIAVIELNASSPIAVRKFVSRTETERAARLAAEVRWGNETGVAAPFPEYRKSRAVITALKGMASGGGRVGFEGWMEGRGMYELTVACWRLWRGKNVFAVFRLFWREPLMAGATPVVGRGVTGGPRRSTHAMHRGVGPRFGC